MFVAGGADDGLRGLAGAIAWRDVAGFQRRGGEGDEQQQETDKEAVVHVVFQPVRGKVF